VKLYLVRWPSLNFSLVRANNERDLIAILDEIADPEGCTWKVYNGPLFLDFRSNVHFEDKTNYDFLPLKPNISIQNADELAKVGPDFKLLGSGSDTMREMWEAVTKFVLPNFVRKIEPTSPDQPDNETVERCKEALVKDLRVFVETEATLHELHKRDDPKASYHKLTNISWDNAKKAGYVKSDPPDPKKN